MESAHQQWNSRRMQLYCRASGVPTNGASVGQISIRNIVARDSMFVDSDATEAISGEQCHVGEEKEMC